MSPGGGGGEKTEKATPKKRRDAREKGQVLKSQEVNTALTLILMFYVLKMSWSFITENGQKLMVHFLSGSYAGVQDVNTPVVQSAFSEAILQMFLMLAPVLIFALIGGVAVSIMQTGFLFTTKTLQPKMNRINPLEGFKRIFSVRTVAELLKSLLKVGIVTYMAYSEISKHFDSFRNLMTLGPVQAFGTILGIAFDVGLKTSMALVVVAVVDYAYQWWKFEKDLKMTKQEIKDEYKQTEGNPEIKSRIKQKQRQMANMRMMQSVPEADVIITNPTHYAVAIKYDETLADAPVVMAKGKDLIAKKIRELAEENGIELVENRPVARALYVYCDVGDRIPEDMFQAVAEILAYVYRRRDDISRGVG